MLCAVGLATLPATPLDAQQSGNAALPSEYSVKAVFLYSFGRYIQWPPESLDATPDIFVIGILGNDPFSGALDLIAAKKTIQERKIVVRRFASLEEYRAPCQILFVSGSLSEPERIAAIRQISGPGVLVVGESPGFAEAGGGANFYIENDHVRFEINAAAARRAGLHMDAQLLNLGKPVLEKEPATNSQSQKTRTSAKNNT